MEVQPILEVLVGKTVEQALVEVLEEEELAALREQQRCFLEIRAVETSEAQRLAERERRLQGERDRKIAEYEEGATLQKEMEERIAAAVLMQGYMADLLPSVLEGLEAEGFLTDNIKQGSNICNMYTHISDLNGKQLLMKIINNEYVLVYTQVEFKAKKFKHLIHLSPMMAGYVRHT